MNSALLAALVASGATSSALPSAWRETLIAAGAADGNLSTFLRQEGYTGSVADMFMKYLGDKGYTGSLTDRIYAASVAQDLFATTSSDPADVDWGSYNYTKRFWWGNTVANSLSVNTDGSGGVPADGGTIGAFLNCDAGNGSTTAPIPLLPYYTGAAATNETAYVAFAYGSLYLQYGAFASMNTDGVTVGFSIACGNTSGANALVLGRDNPTDGAGISSGSMFMHGTSEANPLGTDLSSGPTFVITQDITGLITWWINGVKHGTTSVEPFNSNWERLMNYIQMNGVLIVGMFVTDCVLSDADCVTVHNFLEAQWG